jgi:hypothetical protein
MAIKANLFESGRRKFQPTLNGYLGAGREDERIPSDHELEILAEATDELPGEWAEHTVPGYERAERSREEVDIAVNF